MYDAILISILILYVILITICIYKYYTGSNSESFDCKSSNLCIDLNSRMPLYYPTGNGINREECEGVTSGNMPVIDAQPYDWFRSSIGCFNYLGVPP